MMLQEATAAYASTPWSLLSVNFSCLCGLYCAGCQWAVYHLYSSPILCCGLVLSADDQVFAIFTVLTYNRGPVNTGNLDPKVSTRMENAKWSVKNLLGGYFRHSGLSLAQSLGVEFAQDLATWLSSLHSGFLTFCFCSQCSVWHRSDWLTLGHPSNLLLGPRGLDKSVLRNRPFGDLLLSLMALGQAETLAAGASRISWEHQRFAAHIPLLNCSTVLYKFELPHTTSLKFKC